MRKARRIFGFVKSVGQIAGWIREMKGEGEFYFLLRGRQFSRGQLVSFRPSQRSRRALQVKPLKQMPRENAIDSKAAASREDST